MLRSLRMPSCRLNIKDWAQLHSTTHALLDLGDVLSVALDGAGATLQGPRTALAATEQHLLYVKDFINKVRVCACELSFGGNIKTSTLVRKGIDRNRRHHGPEHPTNPVPPPSTAPEGGLPEGMVKLTGSYP